MKQTLTFILLLLLAAPAVAQTASVSDEFGTLTYIRKEPDNRVVTTYTNNQTCTVNVTVGFADNRTSHAVKPGQTVYFILLAYTHLKVQAKPGWNCAAAND